MEDVKKYAQQHIENLINAAKSDIVSTILDIAGINYTIIDTAGNYIVQNNSILSVVNGTNATSLNAKDIDLKSWEDCITVMQSGQRGIKEEQYKDKYFLSIKQPLIYNEECFGILVVSLDITERKKSEIAKSEFLRNMSHDIRTPLAGIYSMAKMLHDEETDMQKQDCINDIVESSERLTALLNQVLEVTSLGNCSVESAPHSIKDTVDEVIGLMLAAIKAKGLELRVDCPDIVVNSDRFRLSRILLNLLSNAVKFTQQGQIHIKVETDPKLKLTIEDSGIGIPSDKLSHIFDKFTKLKQSGESQTFTGAGIGLYIAKQLANDLGGDISVESELGKGSKFSFLQL